MRRQPLTLVVVALLVVLVMICACEPVAGDGWGHYLSARDPFSWRRFLVIARAYHEHGNPRWGQLVLVLSYYQPLVVWVLSPLAIVSMLLAALTLVRGRWPDRHDPEDAWLLVCIAAAAMLTTPKFGLVWFYRPVCTNYVYPLALQLAWLVPYRFLSLRTGRGSTAATLMIVPLGLLAGAGNEHTGPGLVLAALAAMVIALRRDRRLPGWTITGIASVVVGNAMLLTAPGQQARYEGLAANTSLLSPLVERGVLGSLYVLGIQLLWTIPMLVVVIAVASTRWPSWPRAATRSAIACVAIAGIFVATALLSPKLPIRLLAAPAMMIVIALALAMVELSRDARAARRLRRSCAAIAAIVLGYALVVNVVTGIEGRARLARLETAPPGSTVRIPRYTFPYPHLVSFGDDFRSRALVEDVARRLGLAAIGWP